MNQKPNILMILTDKGMNMRHNGIWGKGYGTFCLNLYNTPVKEHEAELGQLRKSRGYSGGKAVYE